MKPDQVHELVHRDPVTAWPHVIALIERDGPKAHELGLLADLVYSEELPELIDRIEEQGATQQALSIRATQLRRRTRR